MHKIHGRPFDLDGMLAGIGLVLVKRDHALYGRAACACGAHEDIKFPPACTDAQVIRKMATQKGWYVDHGMVTRCPQCPHRPKNGTTTETRKEAVTPMDNGIAAPKSTAPNIVLAPKVDFLTPAQKQAIRQCLDAHFDDAKGMYLDKWSDEAVSAQTKINRATVAEFRERCYGPLKGDPELLAIKCEADKLRGELLAGYKRLDELGIGIENLTHRLSEIGRKLGISL